jgi:hypothetical protein
VGTDESGGVTVRAVPRRPQSLRSRLFWFAAGAGVNYLLIATPFTWLSANTRFPIWAISACSVGFSSVFFLAWNYFVNFRTEASRPLVLARYLSAVVVLWLLSSAVLTALKHVDARLAFDIGGTALDLDIIGTQCFLSGLKFLLYHRWVFPLTRAR